MKKTILYFTWIVTFSFLCSSFLFTSSEGRDSSLEMSSRSINDFDGGNGTSSNPYQISNVTQLQNINANLGAHYIFTSDINALETKNWNEGKGFDPIGDETVMFRGSLDGRGYNIFNLSINRSLEDYIGLFGEITKVSILNDISLIDVNIIGDDRVGGLVGSNDGGTLFNCSVEGNVSGLDNYLGGLVGRNDKGQVSNCTTSGYMIGNRTVGGLMGLNYESIVTNCTTSGIVTGNRGIRGLVGVSSYGDEVYCSTSAYVSGMQDVGGLVGWNQRGMVKNCYAIGNVSGFNVGGLIGINNGEAVNSYATGNVNGEDYVGGLVSFNSGMLSNCYSTGLIRGKEYVGGLIGYNFENTISDCYATGNVNGEDYVGGLIGRNEMSMLYNCFTTNNVSGDDDVGGLVGGNEDSILLNCSATGNVNGDDYIGGLIGVNNGTVYDCSSTGNVNGNIAIGGLVGYNSEGTVSTCFSTGNASGMSGNIGGLIGVNRYGLVSNSKSTGLAKGSVNIGGFVGLNQNGMVANCYTTGNVSGVNHVGGLIGQNLLGIVSNSFYCINITTVNEENRIMPYGIVISQFVDWLNNNKSIDINKYLTINFNTGYYNISNKTDMINILPFTTYGNFNFQQTADIDLSSEPGFYIPILKAGIFDGKDHIISNHNTSINFNEKIGMFGYIGNGVLLTNISLIDNAINGDGIVGGLVGYNDNGTIDHCSNAGNVKGAGDYIGGLVGYNDGVLSHCYTTGTVGGDDHVGGLNGYNIGIVTNCSTSSNVCGTGNNIGGLVGYNENLLSDCYATGNVNGSENNTGGFTGYNLYSGTLFNCYAQGIVRGIENVGGLVGCNDGILTNCHSTGNLSGNRYIGGLAGMNNAMVSNCYATGNLSGYRDVGGLLGYNWRTSVSNCYATGNVYGSGYRIGGLVGYNDEGTVSNCYATGNVSGGDDVGGLVGHGGSYRVSNSFWDNQTSGITTSYVGIGKNTSEMMNKSTFTSANWDFSSVWNIISGYSYPYLRCFDYGTPQIITKDIEIIFEESLYYVEYHATSPVPGGMGAFWNLTTNANDWLLMQENGILTGTPMNDDVGTYWANVTATLNGIDFDYSNFTLTVYNINDDPVILSSSLPDAIEDEYYSYQIEVQDIDLSPDILTWSMKTNASFLVIDPINGNITGLPSNNDVGNWWVNVSIYDGDGGMAWKNFSLNVLNVNDRPALILPELTLTMDEDSMGESINLENVVIDIDGDLISFHYKEGNRLVISLENNIATFIPEPQWCGQEIVYFTASDGNLSIDFYITVVVNPVNDAPFGVSIIAKSSYIEGEDQIAEATGYDADLPYGDVLIFRWESNISGDLGSGQSINLSLEVGIHLITVTVSDSDGLSTMATKEIEIIAEDIEVPVDNEGNDDNTLPIIFVLLFLVLLISIIIIYVMMTKKKDEKHLEE